MGKGTINRPLEEITLERRRQIWELRQRGLTQEKIAQDLNLNQSTVSRALKSVSEEYKAHLKGTVKKYKSEQLGQLEYLYMQAMEAWEKSKTTAKKVVKRTKQAAPNKTVVTPEGTRVEQGESLTDTMQEVVEQVGDVRYLIEARAIMQDIRALIGANAPTKISMTDPTGEKDAPAGKTFFIIPDNGRGDRTKGKRDTTLEDSPEIDRLFEDDDEDN